MANQTEMRAIQLNKIVERDGIKGPEYEYAIQYRNGNGLWISVPLVLTFDKEKYRRMKEGADD